MSTRSRILLALLALTLAPLIGVAGWACLHALRWSPEQIQVRLARAAVQGALDVRTVRADARASLERLIGRIMEEYGDAPDSAAVAATLSSWSGLPEFRTIEIAFDNAAVTARTRVDALPCVRGGSLPPVEVVSGGLRVSGVPASHGLRADVAAESPRLVLVNDGVPVADPTCAAAAGLLPEGAHALPSAAAFPAPVGEDALAVVALPAPGWPSPFPAIGFAILAGALFIGLAAAGAFVILVRDLWRSLDLLTTAADRIGQGDFSPWLPPPTHDEVGRLSFAIGTMAARLEQVMQQNARNRQMAAIGELASHVSHEIRNPLSSIKLNLQSIDREIRAGEVPADLADVVRLCLREINRLDGTVQGVLRLASTGAPLLAPCSLHEVVREALESMAVQLDARGTRVVLNLEAASDFVRGDAVQLRGVVLNLLLNAHDATKETGGRIEIRSEIVEDGARGSLVRVRFMDDGPGIRPEERERIFQPFYTTKPTGTGIGLPLAARVVEAHGGRLYLERSSELTQGAEFVLELPLGAEITEAGALRDERTARWLMRARRRAVPETVA